MKSSHEKLKFSGIKTESAFSKALIEVLRFRGHFVQRIESGLTGRGIPDIYAIINSHPYWIELKRIKVKMKGCHIIPWRPNQERWLRQIEKRGQRALTIVCFDDGLFCIRHDRDYFNKCVESTSYNGKVFSIVTDLVKFLEEGAHFPF